MPMPKIRGGGMKPGAGRGCGQTAGEKVYQNKHTNLRIGFFYIRTDRQIKLINQGEKLQQWTDRTSTAV